MPRGRVEFKFRTLRRTTAAAAARALNRAAAAAKTVAVRLIREDLGVRATDVRPTITTARAFPGRLIAQVVATGRRIPLIRFHAQGHEETAGRRGGGVRYRLGRTRKHLPHAFIATMRSGHRGVFARAGRARLPIVERFGPSVPHVFRQPAIQRAIRARADAILLPTLRRELAFRLGRR